MVTILAAGTFVGLVILVAAGLNELLSIWRHRRNLKALKLVLW
jgi:hypothetical protein